jgi:Kef-type K+ transport system membrane component KefB
MLLLLFAQMALLLVASRLLGELFKRLDQPVVIGELVAGIVLGPSLFGWLWPAGFATVFPAQAAQVHLLEVVAWIGMVMLMLLTGYETDVRLLRHLGRAALTSSLFGMVVPFAAGFVCGELLPDPLLADPSRRHLFAAFFATAMAISAMPVIAKILLDLELTQRDIGVVILSAGVVDDTTGWLVLSVIAGLAVGGGYSPLTMARTLGFTFGFLALCAWVVFPLSKRLFRLVDDRFRTHHNDLALIVVLALLGATATEAIGIHAVFGAFVVGCMLRQVPRLRPASVQRLESVALSVFAPIFFGLVGLKVNLRALGSPWILGLVLGVATAGKLIGSTVGGLVGRLRFWESLSIGMGMNARGAMGLVVALIGLTLGLLNEQMYSVIVAVAVLTSLAAPIALRWTTKRIKLTDEERARMAADAEVGLVEPTRLRALLPTAGGPNALGAARLAAGIARGEGATLTALYVDRTPGGLWRRLTRSLRPPDLAGRNLQDHLEAIKTLAAERAVRVEPRRLDGDDVPALIRREAEHGADLLLLGAGPRARQALRGELIGKLLEAAPCHLAIVRALGRDPFRHLLVPFDGSYFSRSAVELAVLFAEGTGARVTVLYAMEAGDGREEESALDEGFRRMMATTMMTTVSPVLTRTSAQVRVVVREANQTTAPVLRELDAGRYDLVVVGAESGAVQHRLGVGFDVERLVNEAPCSVAVLVPKLTR